MTDNELIAEFMGERVKQFPDGSKRIAYKQAGLKTHYGDIERYSSDWDWLMPVVEKWNNLVSDKQKEFPESKSVDDPTGWKAWSYRAITHIQPIDLVYARLIRGIKWYNQDKEQ